MIQASQPALTADDTTLSTFSLSPEAKSSQSSRLPEFQISAELFLTKGPKSVEDETPSQPLWFSPIENPIKIGYSPLISLSPAFLVCDWD